VERRTQNADRTPLEAALEALETLIPVEQESAVVVLTTRAATLERELGASVDRVRVLESRLSMIETTAAEAIARGEAVDMGRVRAELETARAEARIKADALGLVHAERRAALDAAYQVRAAACEEARGLAVRALDAALRPAVAANNQVVAVAAQAERLLNGAPVAIAAFPSLALPALTRVRGVSPFDRWRESAAALGVALDASPALAELRGGYQGPPAGVATAPAYAAASRNQAANLAAWREPRFADPPNVDMGRVKVLDAKPAPAAVDKPFRIRNPFKG